MCTPGESSFKDGLTSIYELTWIEEMIEERQGPTQGVCIRELSVKKESTLRLETHWATGWSRSRVLIGYLS